MSEWIKDVAFYALITFVLLSWFWLVILCWHQGGCH